MSATKLEGMKSKTPTNCRYLRIADIEDGIVRADASAEYLTELSESARKRCIRNGTVVLSRQGTPSYKSGVAYVEEGQQVLAPGNVYPKSPAKLYTGRELDAEGSGQGLLTASRRSNHRRAPWDVDAPD